MTLATGDLTHLLFNFDIGQNPFNTTDSWDDLLIESSLTSVGFTINVGNSTTGIPNASSITQFQISRPDANAVSEPWSLSFLLAGVLLLGWRKAKGNKALQLA
ncbi:hypothetical protein [uncultured Paraglaciecola sp.]|uniref:hypothetical protein n=1 Tax=uncultured Paraglaciecola sp. TaxID=1765024 RepID=UPI002632C748|nr:hypothetical protein [uncultured Paraglaciecola sp.]